MGSIQLNPQLQGERGTWPYPASGRLLRSRYFIFVLGMPIIVNQNTPPGPGTSGAIYKAMDIILDKAYPGNWINVNAILEALVLLG